MDKLLLIFFFFNFLLTSQADAQNKFYIGGTGGLNRSYSQNENHTNYNFTTPKGGYQAGFNAGYTLASGKAQVETGILFSRYNMLFKSNIDFSDVYPNFYLSYNTYQIPVNFKFILTKPDQKLKVYSLLGIAFIERQPAYDNTKIGFEKNPTFKADTTYDYTHAELPAQLKVKVRVNTNSKNTKSSALLYKAGFGAAYKISDRFELDAVGMFQMGTNVMFAAEADYMHSFQVFPYRSERTIVASSKADALTFNVGLNYHFGKRKPKE